MMKIKYVIVGLVLFACAPSFAQDAGVTSATATVRAATDGPERIWITIGLSEPDATGKSTEAEAKVPLDIAAIVVGALPAKYRLETKEMGFDLAELYRKAEALKVGKSLIHEVSGYKLELGKESLAIPTAAPASMLKLKIEDYNLKAPLAFGPVLVSVLTSVFKTELEGLDKPMLQILETMQKLPPGNYIKATDGYSQFELGLE